MDPSLLANVLQEWDTDGDIPNLKACVTLDAMSLIWESMLAGKGDLIMTLVQLLNFVNESDKHNVERFCLKYSLNELWTIFKHSDQISFQIMIANILAIAIQFKNSALMPICSNKRIDVIYSYVEHFDPDLRQSVLLLLANICDVSESSIHYLIECGIIEKLHTIEISEFFGAMVFQVSRVMHPRLLECVSLVKKCLLEPNQVIINDGVLAAVRLIEQSECFNVQELKSETVVSVLSAIENISNNIDEISLPALFLLFYHCGQLPLEVLHLIFHILEMDPSDNNVTHGCWIFIQNKNYWYTEFNDSLCLEIASLYKNRCYRVQSLIAETLYSYFSFDVLNTTFLDIFITFITDDNLALKMIAAVSRLTRSFIDSSVMKLKIPEILEKMNDALNIDDECVQQAAEEYISEFDS